MFYYHIYGLNVYSEVMFPEFTEISSVSSIDAKIILELPPQQVIDEYNSGKFEYITEDIMWFCLRDELLVYVTNSTMSIWKIDDNMKPERFRAYISTAGIALLLLQKGFQLIHGSAIVFNNQAYLISGASGSGKSTTTLNLLKNPGFLFATDDICAIKLDSAKAILYPGPAFQKICPDVKEQNEDCTYISLLEAGGKYGKRLTSGYVQSPMPVGGMFVLSKNELEHPAIIKLEGVEKMHTITHNLYRGELLHKIGLSPQRVKNIFLLSSYFPLYSITRPMQGDTSKEIDRMITEILYQQ